MTFLDTNVLVAAVLPDHEHHVSCRARLTKLRSGDAACGAHSLAETYTTLTHPGRYHVDPESALFFVEEVTRSMTLVSLTAKEYLQTLRQCAAMSIRGPVVYDALLIACARKVDARRIYTINVKHFCQVAPDLAAIIREP